jgi:beta-lactamase superfamily II metal-dependent hydrolase
LPRLNIQFLDVGQGDGIFIKFPNDRTMLVDLGSLKNKKITNPDILKYFRDHTKFKKAGQTLDWLILTHGDRDHYNMVEEFITTFEIKIANMMYGGNAGDYGGLIGRLHMSQTRAGHPINELRPSGTLPFEIKSRAYFDGVDVQVLAIDSPATSNKSKAWLKNTPSAVLRLEYGGQGVLLCGDATIDTEKAILATLSRNDRLEELKSNVLKAGHHGSARTSISPEWIKAIQPEYVFISADRSGTLTEKGKPTGHRLPQQLAIDIIHANTSRLASAKKHNYVSAYDPADYTKFRKTKAGKGFKNPHTKEEWGARKTWVQFTNTDAIFTTLASMDMKSADCSEADQGAQYGLDIRDDGQLVITTTEETYYPVSR